MEARRQGACRDDRPLARRFFEGRTEDVARALLGCRLVHRLPGGAERTVVIVETEAYLGVGDRAANTWNGRRTLRVLPMWGPAGHAYVYQVYGLHYCMNVVTREEGVPEAVLLRAAVSEAWWAGETTSREEILVASGPGKLCRALAIDKTLSGVSLSGPELRLARGSSARAFQVVRGPRVGVGYSKDAALWPLRFGVAGCPAVTRPGALAQEADIAPVLS